MSKNDIIDVQPISQSSNKATIKNTQPVPGYFTYSGATAQPSPSASACASSTTYHTCAEAASTTAAPVKPKSRVGGAVKIVAGGAIALAGVPMLILPGPGLLAIGGGVALMASGAKNLAGR